MSDYAQVPRELRCEVIALVNQTRKRSGWPVRRTLKSLDIPRSTYARWLQQQAAPTCTPRSSPDSLFALLPSEQQAILDYALKHPEVRHRELSWKMLDDGVCAASSSSVYRVLQEANLVCRWKPRSKAKGSGRPDQPKHPNELWQTDIRYTKVGERNYYLLSFMDVYSRYIVHHELLRGMDAVSVSIAAAAALAKLPKAVKPTIQSDHGSCFIAREFAGVLTEFQVGHSLIRPHTPTDNAVIERYHRTIGERIDEHELQDCEQARKVIDAIIDHYNHQRLHSSLSFLRPVDWYRGDPETLLAERSRKLQTARDLRKQENLKLRQRRIPWLEEKTVA